MEERHVTKVTAHRKGWNIIVVLKQNLLKCSVRPVTKARIISSNKENYQ